jgi:hypothetical protein
MENVFVCTECTYPSYLADCCDNPACLANPRANHEALRTMKAENDKRKAEDAARADFRKSLRRSGFTSAF